MYLSLSLIHSYHNNKMAFSSSSSLCLSYGYGYLRLPTTTRTRKRSANPKAGSSRSLQAKAASTSPSTFTSLRTSNVRLDLLLAISIQGALRSQQVLRDFTAEARNFLSFREGQPRSLEEALMTVPNLETTPYRILLKNDAYEIREYESYLVAETEMAGQSAFGFFASSQAFNTLASYLFGKNTKRVEMKMTTPVLIQIDQKKEEKMEMTTPVLFQKKSEGSPWTMAFVLPSKYSEDNFPLPDDPAVVIKRVLSKLVAAVTFSDFVTDEIVKQRERKLRLALQNESLFKVKELASVQVAQYNPPFTLPFMRCNEVLLEVEKRDESNM
ncbi:hypothetical protein O6H91_02G085900 [Diphasiastrum complanatum]|uniref:Uncharacterized protein n=1 Tax=Diphasiastrum complanatum TaxID=34168 RepID=A0ACC2EHJ3_DIPCM|nr:hypothetical protein O6H91_02G085900 [Diphasiastrum complanatum]